MKRNLTQSLTTSIKNRDELHANMKQAVSIKHITYFQWKSIDASTSSCIFLNLHNNTF